MTSPGIWGRKIYFCETLLYRRNSIQTPGVYTSIMLLLLLGWIKVTSPRVSNTKDRFIFSCQCCIQRGHRAPGRWRGLPEIIMQVINGKSEFFFDISRLYTPTNYYPSVNLESIYRWIYYSWPVFVKCCNVLCQRYLCACSVAKFCPTLCDPMGCGLPGFSVYRIYQAIILGWVAIPSSRASSWALLHLLHWQADSLPLCHLESLQRC